MKSTIFANKQYFHREVLHFKYNPIPTSLTTTVPFEILVATMFRTNLEFLEEMFPGGNYQEYQILVINQTDQDKELVASSKNLRVINTLERGLSNSRNMALQHAIGEICLFADDDVRYIANMDQVVVNAFAKAPSASVMTFQAQDEHGHLYREYPEIKRHTKNTVYTVNGVVIALRLQTIKEHQLTYSPLFGLGAPFETADEYVFLRDVLAADLEIGYEPTVILSHPSYNSGKDMGSDRVVFARGALKQKYLGGLSYLWVFKYVRFLWAHGYISKKEVIHKIKVGFAGIKKFKQLNAKAL